ncbi:hypothetical protein DIURU_001512 [Diutina rugosa]|uniref:Uncharacterized protein n=1 Tax=Diutina rugosa TaxID=5481 RepID=A0A642UT58_DIURU|nr:uncharacterized protein DIURU_001512 [Diutina rugosa]KAA8905084.1 hypothetical protein DIURU_001512 [Diutina rugosa]
MTSGAYPDKPRHVSCFSVSVPHPLNVKPQGNALMADTERLEQYRRHGLGHLSIWPDELVMTLLGYLDQQDLLSMSHTSKMMYAFGYDEELWKKVVVAQTGEKEEPQWKGSWRLTALQLDPQYQANILLEDNQLCSDVVYRPFQCSQIDYPRLFAKIIAEEEVYHRDSLQGCLRDLPPGRIARFSENDVDSARFNSELHDTPFILTNSDSNRWPRWDATELLKRFGSVQFRQEMVQWSLATYCKYMANNRDESPLYLFDCASPAMKTLIHEYKPPQIFSDDMFTVFSGEQGNCRPDHAWLIVGPQRSGSTFHKDPNYTSAWNTALTGRKLWVMLPPDVVPPGVGTDGDESEVTSPVGMAEWVLSGFFNDALKIPSSQVGVTFPGECMYVPSGWWHAVINLDDSVALTQNFVPPSKLTNALRFMKDKPHQLSGFRPNRVAKVVEKVVAENDVPELRQFLEKMASANVDGDEDCAELGCDLDIPVYTLFCQLMELSGRKEVLDKALASVKKTSEAQPSRWQQLTAVEGTGFSFGLVVD